MRKIFITYDVDDKEFFDFVFVFIHVSIATYPRSILPLPFFLILLHPPSLIFRSLPLMKYFIPLNSVLFH